MRVCFTGRPGPRLVASNPRAADYIENVHHVRSGARIAKAGRSFSLQGVNAGDCVGYEIDLAEMKQSEGFSRHVRVEGDSVLLRQSMWLWYANDLPRDIPVTMTLNLPEGVEASVPWTLAPGQEPTARSARSAHYQLDSTAFWWIGYNAFGKLGLQRFEAGGADLEVAVLDAPMQASDVGLRAWAEDAAESSALLFGRFPREHLQVLVVPVDGGGDGSVYFGMAGRGGGAGVYILMDREVRDGELPGGWTTVHELLHHGMPFIEEPWMAEGWVSYYTELQRTRMGHRDERKGWQQLLEAFARGQSTRRSGTLAEVSAAMHSNFGYQRVYWGGAAIAFLTDIALRQDSGGEVTLDDAMVELRRCCGEARHKWSAQVLLEKLDAWYGKPLFTQIAQRHLASEAFAPIEAGYEALGIELVDGRVVLDDAHPMAEQRRSIMAPRKQR